ncbi:MAG: nucleotidyltransferase family protein [Desulfurobacteriaceae bacterium]
MTEKKKLTEKEIIIDKLKKIENYLEKEYGIKRIGVFGSIVRNEQKESSDIDILIETSGNTLSLIKYMKLKFFLENIFNRKVDLVLKKALKPRLREKILKEVIYVKK